MNGFPKNFMRGNSFEKTLQRFDYWNGNVDTRMINLIDAQVIICLREGKV